MACQGTVILSAFYITKSFQEKLRCGNLLFGVHELYSDSSGVEDAVEAANHDNNVQPR